MPKGGGGGGGAERLARPSPFHRQNRNSPPSTEKAAPPLPYRFPPPPCEADTYMSALTVPQGSPTCTLGQRVVICRQDSVEHSHFAVEATDSSPWAAHRGCKRLMAGVGHRCVRIPARPALHCQPLGGVCLYACVFVCMCGGRGRGGGGGGVCKSWLFGEGLSSSRPLASAPPFCLCWLITSSPCPAGRMLMILLPTPTRPWALMETSLPWEQPPGPPLGCLVGLLGGECRRPYTLPSQSAGWTQGGVSETTYHLKSIRAPFSLQQRLAARGNQTEQGRC